MINSTHNRAGQISHPKPMRGNPIVSLMLGAASVVLAVGMAECRPVTGADEITLGIPGNTDIRWLGADVESEPSTWAQWEQYLGQ